MDQSNKAMEVFNILDAVNGEADAELSKPKTLRPPSRRRLKARGSAMAMNDNELQFVLKMQDQASGALQAFDSSVAASR